MISHLDIVHGTDHRSSVGIVFLDIRETVFDRVETLYDLRRGLHKGIEGFAPVYTTSALSKAETVPRGPCVAQVRASLPRRV